MWLPCAFYCICAAIAAGISQLELCIPAGLVLITAAILLAVWFYYLERSLISFPFLLSLFWIAGEGLGAMQLSTLQDDWTVMSWICFGGFYVLFLIGYGVCKLALLKTPVKESYRTYDEACRKRLLISIAAVSFGSFATFLLEACLLGYVPLFSTETHAYDHFHVTGVHYFTVSCMFTHALTAIYLLTLTQRPGRKVKGFLLLCNAMSLLIPILSVSKFQFVLTLALPILIFLLLRPEVNKRRLFGVLGAAAAVIIGAAVFMTMNRHYEPGYLNGIFQMKNETMPLFLQYAYMYIANNYSNFNCLTMAMESGMLSHAFGLKQLFPVFALTGLKFVCPSLVLFYMPTTIQELNTLTLIYDAFYDFGLPGVLGFGLILGIVCGAVACKSRCSRNPVWSLFYAQLAMYLMLSFFSAWFTVPTTWFWFALTAVIYWYVGGAASKFARRK